MKSFILIALLILTANAAPNGAEVIANCQDSRFTFCGGEAECWLTIERYNTKAIAPKCFDPSYTQIICDFKPIPRKRADGKWEVIFVTEDVK